MQCTAVFVSKALKDLFFCLVFIAVENMSSIHKKQQKKICLVFIKSSRKLSVNENVAFLLIWNE